MTILLATICGGLAGFLKFYMALLTIRIYLTWFPNLNFYTQPFYSIAKMTDPYLRVFRGIFPPLIGIDLSPIIAFLLLSFLIDVCTNTAGGIS
jgi:YggT family protein